MSIRTLQIGTYARRSTRTRATDAALWSSRHAKKRQKRNGVMETEKASLKRDKEDEASPWKIKKEQGDRKKTEYAEDRICRREDTQKTEYAED